MGKAISEYVDLKITMGNIITILMILVGGIWTIAELDKTNALLTHRLTNIEKRQEQTESITRSLSDMQGDIRYLRQVIERELKR